MLAAFLLAYAVLFFCYAPIDPLLLSRLAADPFWICVVAFVCGQVFFLDRAIKTPYYAAYAAFAMGMMHVFVISLEEVFPQSADFRGAFLAAIRVFGCLSLAAGLVLSRFPKPQEELNPLKGLILWEAVHFSGILLTVLIMGRTVALGIIDKPIADGLAYTSMGLLIFAVIGPVRDYIRRMRGAFGYFILAAILLMLAAQSGEVFRAPESFNPLWNACQMLAYVAILWGILNQCWTGYRKDQEALFLLADTQGLLAERKYQLEQANKKLLKINDEFKRVNEKTSLILETANDAFIAIDAGGIVSEWNRQAESIFGWKREEAIGKKLVSIIIPEEFKRQLESDIRKFFTTGSDPVVNRQMEVTAIHRDGHEFPAELSISILKSQRGYSFNAFVRDITARRKTEVEIAKRAEDLARSNADLEQFAYVASHDLQEPLRMVGSYTQLLARKYSGKLDSDADEFIQFAVDGVKRMQQLINDLLEYSRVGTRKKEFGTVQSADVVRGALENLQVAVAESGAEVIVAQEMPQVRGDDVQLTQLFQNLIGNAIKFRGERKPIIEIGWEVRAGETVFHVRDNGIGIDPRFKDRIFVIFQRLHGANDYPGTGIGLAVCKKIVERHGGRIWIESSPDQGATFYFTLPAQTGDTVPS